MALSDIVNVSITSATVTPSRVSFGVPMIAAYHTVGTALVQTYTSVAGMTTAGFSASHPAVLAATAIFSQNPHVTKIKVGKRTGMGTQTWTVTCNTNTNGQVYSLTVGANTYTLTVSSQTTSQIATAFAALIDADSAVSASAVSNVITITASTINTFVKMSAPSTAYYDFADTTTESNVAADLAAFVVADPDWYALLMPDGLSSSVIATAANWTESNNRIFLAQTQDTLCESSTSTGVAKDLKTSAYNRTAAVYQRSSNVGELAPAWTGQELSADPGSLTWKFKTLAGVAADTFTATAETNLNTNKANYYETIAGVNCTFNGNMASGEWIDVIQGRDWLISELQVELYALLLNNPKVPYTDLGVDMVKNVIFGVLKQGADRGILDGVRGFVVTAPKVADISSIDKGNRNLPNVQFQAYLAGAIHAITINGTVSL